MKNEMNLLQITVVKIIDDLCALNKSIKMTDAMVASIVNTTLTSEQKKEVMNNYEIICVNHGLKNKSDCDYYCDDDNKEDNDKGDGEGNPDLKESMELLEHLMRTMKKRAQRNGDK